MRLNQATARSMNAIVVEVIKAERYSYLHFRNKKTVFLYILIFLGLYLGLILYRAFYFPSNLQNNLPLLIAVAYTLLVAISVLIRFPLAFSFDPSKYVDINYEPTVSVVIPAYNEEKTIAQTIQHVLASNYPKDKLEVFVINDGSRDFTGTICKQFADKGLITFSNFTKNRGKREGLYEGFTKSKGEILVVIDSDTFIDKDCIKEIVKPLANPMVGGVCGHTDVRNRNKLLTKIQQANYFAGFHIYKKAESLFNNVTCLSGCASAYRKSAVITFIDDWRKQRFLGTQCTYGEDRALTTFLLKTGAKIVYNPSARAVTEVPETLKKLFKQRIRWKRSFVRETYLQSKFMYKRSLGGAFLFYTFSITNLISPLISIYYLNFLPIGILYGSFGHVVTASEFVPTTVYLLGMLLTSSLYAFYSKLYNTFPIGWTIGWSFFNTIVITFGTLYAYLTLKSSNWMTR